MQRLGKSLIVSILIILSTLSYITSLPLGLAQSGTNVNGIITSNTTWTQANSPYTLTGPVLVSNGIVLTIQAGTTVNLGSYYLEVNGTLQAIGSSLNPITFNSAPNGQINFTQYSSNWNQQTQTGCVIENTVSTCSINIYQVSPLISNNQFTYSVNRFSDSSGIYVWDGSPIISNNTSNGVITNVYQGSGNGLALISGNTIKGNYGGITCNSNNCNIIDNTLIGCEWAIEVGGQTSGATIEGNLIYQSEVGIYFYNTPSGQAIIQNNTIANCTIGIQLPSPSSTIIYNNFLNNQLSISLIDNHANILQSNNIDAPYNYWGTTDEQAINQTIFDFKDNFNLGTVNFTPFLAIPNSQTPTLPTSSPIPTPTPTQTAITASLPTPTSTPSIPELSWFAIVPLLLFLFSVAVIVRHRKTAYLKQ
jgi:hypothetical protein